MEVRASLARKVEQEFVPEATGSLMRCLFPSRGSIRRGGAAVLWSSGKDGQLSGGGDVGPGTEESSTPLDWALYLPKPWATDPVRRKKAGIPEEVSFKTKPELALDLIDEVKGWACRIVWYWGFALWRCVRISSGFEKSGVALCCSSEQGLTGWTEDPRPGASDERGEDSRKRFYADDFPALEVSARWPRFGF